MKLAMRVPKGGKSSSENDDDPRDGETAEIIDLASRTAYPAVAGHKGKSDGLGLAAGVAIVGLLGAATLWGMNASRTAPAEDPQANAPAPVAPVEEVPQVVVQQPVVPNAASAGAPRPDPAPAPILAQRPMAQAVPVGNPYASPTIVFDSGGAAQTVAVPTSGITQADADGSTRIPGSGSAGDFASRVGGVGGGPAQARVDIDPTTTVTQGTMIPAILETAIDTDVPGYVRAVVSQDVRSFDGKSVLIPRSSRLIGQYESGVQQGQKRAYVIWTRLIRPDGVSVALASPGTAFDGSGGLPGDVDNHFFKRFGSAMLLSVIGGLTTIATGGSNVILGGGQSAATTALQQDGQIGPTIRIRPGEPVRVVTARDLDFSQAPRVR